VIALDVSPTALELGREAWRRARLPPQTPPPEFVVYDGLRFPLPDTSVDRIACYDAMHHVPNKRAVLGEMHRVLAPGGLACFVEPGPGHSRSPDARHEVARWDVLEDEIDVAEFCALATDAGFESTYALPLVFPTERPMSPQEFRALHQGARERALDWRGNDALVTAIKGTYLPDSRRPSRLAARIEVLELSSSLTPGQAGEARLRVTNSGDTRWLRMPPTGNLRPVTTYRRHIEANGLQGLVALGAHLHDLQFATEIAHDYARGFLPADVRPGESCEVTVTLPPPGMAGTYGVTFDMVDEYVTWFGDCGSPLELEYLRVEGPGSPADSRAPDRLSAELRLVEHTTPGVLVIDARNLGNTVWLRGPLTRGGHVQLGVQRLDRDGRVDDRDWVRAALPHSVVPEDVARIRVDVSHALRESARAALLIDLVAEGRCWFAERGSRPLTVST
jgi:hypothetical protein